MIARVCCAYVEDLGLCDCGCGEYRCPACETAFSFVETPLNQDLNLMRLTAASDQLTALLTEEDDDEDDEE